MNALTDVAGALRGWAEEHDDVDDEFGLDERAGGWGEPGDPARLIIGPSYAELDAKHTEEELADLTQKAKSFGWTLLEGEGHTHRGRTRYPLIPA